MIVKGAEGLNFFQVSLIRCNIPSVRKLSLLYKPVRALNDPYESNELNLPLADRYSVGVLDMGNGR